VAGGCGCVRVGLAALAALGAVLVWAVFVFPWRAVLLFVMFAVWWYLLVLLWRWLPVVSAGSVVVGACGCVCVCVWCVVCCVGVCWSGSCCWCYCWLLGRSSGFVSPLRRGLRGVGFAQGSRVLCAAGTCGECRERIGDWCLGTGAACGYGGVCFGVVGCRLLRPPLGVMAAVMAAACGLIGV
jgi:hypothetical protein